jgi:hypothetical protein
MRSFVRSAAFCITAVAASAQAETPTVKPSEPALKVAYVAGMDAAPAVIGRAAPVYPQELRAKGVQGTALVDARVDSTGRVIGVELVKATRPNSASVRWKRRGLGPSVRRWRRASRSARASGSPSTL